MAFLKQNPCIFSMFYFSHIMLSLSHFFSVNYEKNILCYKMSVSHDMLVSIFSLMKNKQLYDSLCIHLFMVQGSSYSPGHNTSLFDSPLGMLLEHHSKVFLMFCFVLFCFSNEPEGEKLKGREETFFCSSLTSPFFIFLQPAFTEKVYAVISPLFSKNTGCSRIEYCVPLQSTLLFIVLELLTLISKCSHDTILSQNIFPESFYFSPGYFPDFCLTL